MICSAYQENLPAKAIKIPCNCFMIVVFRLMSIIIHSICIIAFYFNLIYMCYIYNLYLYHFHLISLNFQTLISSSKDYLLINFGFHFMFCNTLSLRQFNYVSHLLWFVCNILSYLKEKNSFSFETQYINISFAFWHPWNR